MSEPKSNAEILSALYKKFDKLNILAEKYDLRNTKIKSDELNKDLAEIRKVIEEINIAPEQIRNELIFSLQKFVAQIIDGIFNQNAKLEFFKAVIGGLDVNIIKKVLFERIMLGGLYRAPFDLLRSMLANPGREPSIYQIFHFLTEKYPDWVNVRVIPDKDKYESFKPLRYIYNKEINDPLAPEEEFLIFHALRPHSYWVTSEGYVQFIQILIAEGANLSVKASPSVGEKALTPLEFFDHFSSAIKQMKFTIRSPKDEKAADDAMAQMRARIVETMEAQKQKGMRRAEKTQESLGAVRRGRGPTEILPPAVLDIISQYGGDAPVDFEREERQRKEYEAYLREVEARAAAEAKAVAEKAAGQKLKPGPSGGLDDEEPKEKPKPQGPQGPQAPQDPKGKKPDRI